MTGLTYRAASCLALLIIAVPPASAQDGAAAYKQNCAACHDAGVDRAPNREALQSMTAERVLAALESGAMISMASRSSAAERRAIAQFVTGKALSTSDVDMTPAPQSMCAAAGNFTNPLTGPLWNGWGENTSNTRFQDGSAAGFTAPEVARLKVKWAFGFPGDLDANAQPTIVGGRVFVGSQGGKVYSLSADTGCIHWFVQAAGAVRAAVTIGRIETSAGSTYAAFFGDLSGNVYAVNATTGAPLWKVKADPHPLARIVGSPVFHVGGSTSRWRRLKRPPAPLPSTSAAAFAGACRRWTPPPGNRSGRRTRSPKKHARSERTRSARSCGDRPARACGAVPRSTSGATPCTSTTGDNYSDPPSSMSDSFVAMDLDTGKILWSRQMTSADAWNTACRLPDKTNCPDVSGPDFDFASPPILVTLPNGRRALVAGQKSGVVHAVDPDEQGKILWQERVGSGGTLGGVQWGSAADRSNVYVALSDIVRITIPNSLGTNADPDARRRLVCLSPRYRRTDLVFASAGLRRTGALQSRAVGGGQRDSGRRVLGIG